MIQNYQIIMSLSRIDNLKENNKNKSLILLEKENNVCNSPSNKQINVVSSIVEYKYELDLEKIKNTVNLMRNNTEFLYKSEFIVIIFDLFSLNNGEVLLKNKHIKIFKFNLIKFVYDLVSKKLNRLENLIKLTILGSDYFNKNSENLLFNENMRNRKLIFIFNNITLSNILFLFKLLDITIYGGSSNRRHILSSVHLNLVSFLLLINNMYVNPNIIYKSFNNVSNLNNKYDKHILALLKNLPQSAEEIKKYHKQESSPLRFYNFINLMLKVLDNIINSNKKIEELELEILSLIKENLVIKNRKKEVTKMYFGSFLNKKLKNADLKIEQNTNEIKEKNKRLLVLNSELKVYIKNIYTLDPSLFDSNGICLFNDKLNIDLSEFNTNNNENLIENNNFNLDKYSESETDNYYNKKNNNSNSDSKSNPKSNNNNNIYINKNNINNNNIQNKKINQKREYSSKVNITNLTLKDMNIIPNLKNINNNLIPEVDIENIYKKKEPVEKNNNLESENSYFQFKENANSYLLLVDEILKDNHMDPREAQLKLETEWTSYYISKLSNENSKIVRNMSSIIKKASESLNLHLRIKNKKSIKESHIYKYLNKNHLIIAFSTILTYHNKLGFTAIAMIIARNIIISIYFDLIKNKIIDKNISFVEFKESCNMMEDINLLKLGSLFIDIFCHFPTDVFEKNYKKPEILDDEYDNTPISILEINSNFLNKIKNNLFVSPLSLPMICKPNNWSEEVYGGFLNNSLIKKEIITGNLLHNHKTENKDKLFNAINYLNSIEFKINTNLLNFLEKDGIVLINHYLKNIENKSEILQFNTTLNIAKSFSKLNTPFFINTNADWRGRIYTQSFYLSYQSGDLSTALINLYKGEKITEKGLNYLYIYGANCHNEKNISKKSFNQRINWVKDNLDKIVNLDIEFILKADSIFLFTAFCLTVRDFHLFNKDIVHLPVFLDATCSGIQHLAALIKDQEIGQKVNLVAQTDDDQVNDLYSDLLDPVNKAINEYGFNSKNDCEMFKNIKLERLHIKRPIMTKNYNVSIIGMANQLRAEFKKINYNNKNKVETRYLVPTKDKSFIVLNYYQVFILAQIINDQIYKSLPSLKKIYNYFKEIIQLGVTLNIPTVWLTPAGLKITQIYNISEQNKVSIKFGKINNTVVLRKKTNKLDKKKQSQAIIPNIIHSLDASHLMNLLDTAISLNFKNILPVHDCFGTHPNYVDDLIFLVKKEFISLYVNSEFLKKYHDRFLQALSDNNFKIEVDQDGNSYIKPKRKKIFIPNLPEIGTLDLQETTHSKHFIT